VDLLESAASAAPPLKFLNRYNAPRWLFRTVACLVLGGQVMARIAQGEGVCGGGGGGDRGWVEGWAWGWGLERVCRWSPVCDLHLAHPEHAPVRRITPEITSECSLLLC
jgi:hypothetical protein